jgi:uncharacterized peroxidase-related enzyme
MENRIQLLNQSEASQESQELLGQVKKNFGSIPNVFKLMANSSAVLKSYLDFSGNLSNGVLSKDIQERIALLIAQENDCEYCLAAHSAIAKGVGLSEEEILHARQGNSSDKRAEAALSFAKSIFVYSGDVQDSELASLRENGFSDAEILEIVAAVSLNVLTNSLNNLARTKLDFPQAKELESCCGCCG